MSQAKGACLVSHGHFRHFSRADIDTSNLARAARLVFYGSCCISIGSAGFGRDSVEQPEADLAKEYRNSGSAASGTFDSSKFMVHCFSHSTLSHSAEWRSDRVLLRSWYIFLYAAAGPISRFDWNRCCFTRTVHEHFFSPL